MLIEADNEKKLLLIWRTASESVEPLPEEVRKQMRDYKARKYAVIVLDSGSGDLFDNTAGLLIQNRNAGC